MNKDEILKKSREENRIEDERENQLRKSAALPAIIAMGVTCVSLMVLEQVFLDTSLLTDGMYLIINIVGFVQYWYLFVILKRKYLIITAICFTGGSILGVLNMIDTFISMM